MTSDDHDTVYPRQLKKTRRQWTKQKQVDENGELPCKRAGRRHVVWQSRRPAWRRRPRGASSKGCRTGLAGTGASQLHGRIAERGQKLGVKARHACEGFSHLGPRVLWAWSRCNQSNRASTTSFCDVKVKMKGRHVRRRQKQTHEEPLSRRTCKRTHEHTRAQKRTHTNSHRTHQLTHIINEQREHSSHLTYQASIAQ